MKYSPRGEPVPAEGDDGLFSESWFPICLSEEALPGKISGFDFLDGRVIVVRAPDGTAQVLSAYCPHLGADLSVGEMIDGHMRCAFHHWSFSPYGECVATACGDPAPKSARLFRFPTVERHGVIYAFNGEEPSFDLPDFPFPDDQLLIRTSIFDQILNVDPWVVCCNTPDMQHIRTVHGIEFDDGPPHKEVEWTNSSMFYDVRGVHRNGERIHFRVGIQGTSIFYQEGEIDGRWFGFLAPFGLPRPRQTRAYLILAVQKDSDDPDGANAFLDNVYELERRVVFEDIPILETARFRPGTFTKSDASLARFLEYLRDFPRSHVAGDAMR